MSEKLGEKELLNALDAQERTPNRCRLSKNVIDQLREIVMKMEIKIICKNCNKELNINRQCVCEDCFNKPKPTVSMKELREFTHDTESLGQYLESKGVEVG